MQRDRGVIEQVAVREISPELFGDQGETGKQPRRHEAEPADRLIRNEQEEDGIVTREKAAGGADCSHRPNSVAAS